MRWVERAGGLSLQLLIFATGPACVGAAMDVRAEAPSKPALSATPGARIAAADGHFVVGDRPIEIRDRAYCANLGGKPTTDNFGLVVGESGAVFVRVSYPNLAQPLYGILAFCDFPSDYAGAASRSYRIEIPSSFVDATEGGRVSVVYEPYGYAGGELVAWVLWLARDATAFPGMPAGPVPAGLGAEAAGSPPAAAPAAAASAPADAPAAPAK